MKTCFAWVVAAALGFATLPSVAAEGEPWMCSYKGATESGDHHYIAVRPFEGPSSQHQMLNSGDFAKALFRDIAPDKRSVGGPACAQRPREFTEQWFDKILAGKGTLHSPYNTTLAEWRDGRLVRLPWPGSGK